MEAKDGILLCHIVVPCTTYNFILEFGNYLLNFFKCSNGNKLTVNDKTVKSFTILNFLQWYNHSSKYLRIKHIIQKKRGHVGNSPNRGSPEGLYDKLACPLRLFNSYYRQATKRLSAVRINLE